MSANERLQDLGAKAAAGTATDEEHLEWAELSVRTLDAAREERVADAHRMAADYFGYLVGEFGEETARAAWKAIPARRRGYRVSDAKRRADALVVEKDDFLRTTGVKREEAAARALENGKDQHDARRGIDRTKARLRAKP